MRIAALARIQEQLKRGSAATSEALASADGISAGGGDAARTDVVACWRQALVAGQRVAVELFRLLEGSLAWVTGCAWVNVVSQYLQCLDASPEKGRLTNRQGR